VVSSWIGETEKNLAALFDRAGQGDEADSLFDEFPAQPV
jgi:SpoVK/Ycf46/Vps4 family AAA+-type ATPase